MKPLDLQVNINSLLRYSKDQNVENHKGGIHQLEIDEKAIKDGKRSTQKVNENEETLKSDWEKEKSERDITKDQNQSKSKHQKSFDKKDSEEKTDSEENTYKNHSDTGHKDYFA